MGAILYFIFSTCFACCLGLEFTLTQDQPALSGKRTFCGILTCSENTVNTSAEKIAGHSPHISFQNISTLSVYRQVSLDVVDTGSSHREILVASLSPQSPSVTRVVNGLKIAGSLGPEGATVRVEMVKSRDCMSVFSCRVRGVDTQGRNAVGEIKLLAQGLDQDVRHADGEGLKTSESLQLLTSVQQVVAQSEARLGDKLESVVDRLLSRIEGFEHKLSEDVADKTDAMENKLKMDLSNIQRELGDKSLSLERLFQNRLLLLENRLEDKIESGKNAAQFSQGDVNLSQKICSNLNTNLSNSFDNNCKELQTIQKQSLDELLHTLQNNVTSFISSCAKSEPAQVRTCKDTDSLANKNQTESVQDTVESGAALSQKLQSQLRASTDQVLAAVKDLRSSVHNCTAQLTPAHMRNLSSHRETLVVRYGTLDTAYVLTVCKPWLTLRPSLFTSQYALVQETGKDSNDFPYLCDTSRDTDGGGWIVIQRRSSGNVDFNRLWDDYKTGFGSFYDDFWLGNDKIYAITTKGAYDLHVTLKYKDKMAYARYADFTMANETENYKLNIGRYFGTAGDSLAYHNGAPFSTIDRNNDDSGAKCAVNHGGGWWFKSCDKSNLNGNWGAGADLGVEWTSFAKAESVSYCEMKIRLNAWARITSHSL